MAKFDAMFLFPLQDQVWTHVSEQRRETLAANGGGLTGPQFFTTSFMAYLRPDGIRFVDYFPWITLPAHAAPAYHGAVVDQTYRTGSITAFMPTFLALELLAAVACFRPRTRAPLRGAALADADRRPHHRRRDGLRLLRQPLQQRVRPRTGVRRRRRHGAPGPLPGPAPGVASPCDRGVDRGGALLDPRADVDRVGDRCLQLSRRAAGALRPAPARAEPRRRWPRRTFQLDGLPDGGTTDDLVIRGDCDALYINTGDKYEPWLPVQERDRALTFDYDVQDLQPGSATVLTVTTTREDRVDVQVNSKRQMRFLVYSADAVYPLRLVRPAHRGWRGAGHPEQDRLQRLRVRGDTRRSGELPAIRLPGGGP